MLAFLAGADDFAVGALAFDGFSFGVNAFAFNSAFSSPLAPYSSVPGAASVNNGISLIK